MSVLSWLLTATSLALGAACLYLHSELDAARGRADAIARRSEQMPYVAGHEAPAEDLEPARSVGAAPESAVDLVADNAAGSFPAGARWHQPSQQQERALLRRMYSEFTQDLRLSPDEETQTLNLLLEHRNELMETMRRHTGDRVATTEEMSELRQKHQTELMMQLGDKYLEFEEYQKTLQERMQIEQAALQLEAAGTLLRDDQRKQLLDVMVEERDRVPWPAWTSGVPLLENVARQQDWQADYDERVRSRATTVLSSDQVKQYDVYSNLRTAQRRRQLEAWRDERRPRSESRAENLGSI